jgi:Tfp pilus assembly protein PilE
MKKQHGMTFIGLVLMVAGIVFVAVIGMKMIPSYLEFMSVKKAITNIANNPEFREMTTKDIHESFKKTAVIDNIQSVSANELIISQSDLGPVVTAEYQVVVPLMGNVSALIDFYTSTDE